MLEDTARSLARRWGVIIEEPVQETLTAWLCFGRRDGDAVVIKLPKPDDDEVNAALVDTPARAPFCAAGADTMFRLEGWIANEPR